MSVPKKEPWKCYSRADKAYNLVIKLPSEQLKSYDSFSMPCTINITKHKNWSQLFQHEYWQCNKCIIGSEGSEKCATTIFRAENICIMFLWNYSAYLQIYMVSHSKRNQSKLKPSQYLNLVNFFGLATVSGVWPASTWTFRELSLFSSSGKLNTSDVSPCHIHTCPKPWLIVGFKPMRACGWRSSACSASYCFFKMLIKKQNRTLHRHLDVSILLKVLVILGALVKIMVLSNLM